MKLSRETTDGVVTVFVSGEVMGGSCNCLEHFWERYVDGSAGAVRLDASGITAIDADGVAAVLTLLRRCVAAALAVGILSPPRLLVDIIGRQEPDDVARRIEIFRHDAPSGGSS